MTTASPARSMSGWASRPSGSSTRSSSSLSGAPLAQAAAAGEVRRGAHVAAEGGIGDGSRVPGERLLRRGLDREVGGPPGALVIELGQLVQRELPAEAAPQLVLDLARDALEGRLLLGIGLLEPAQPGPPLLLRTVVRHAEQDRNGPVGLFDAGDDVGPLAGLDHAEPPCLALESARRAQLGLALLQPLVLSAQVGHLLALPAGLPVGLDPAHRGTDVEIEDER